MPQLPKWVMPAAIIGALLLLLVTCGNARAQQAPAGEMQCAPLSEALPYLVESAQRTGAATMPLVGEPAQAFLRVMNAEPPITDFKADAILAIAPVDGDAVLVFFVHKARQEICGYVTISGALAGKALLASKAMAPKA